MLGGQDNFHKALVAMDALPSLQETFKKSEAQAVDKMKEQVKKQMDEFVKNAKPALDKFNGCVREFERFSLVCGEIKD